MSSSLLKSWSSKVNTSNEIVESGMGNTIDLPVNNLLKLSVRDKNRELKDFRRFKNLNWMIETWGKENIGCMTVDDSKVIDFTTYLKMKKRYFITIGSIMFFNRVTLFTYLKESGKRKSIKWFTNLDGFTQFKLQNYVTRIRTYEGVTKDFETTLESEIEDCSKNYAGSKVDFDTWQFGHDRSYPCVNSEEFYLHKR